MSNPDRTGICEKRICKHVDELLILSPAQFYEICPCRTCLVKGTCDQRRKLDFSAHMSDGVSEYIYFCETFYTAAKRSIKNGILEYNGDNK
jgi:hypothetical protein